MGSVKSFSPAKRFIFGSILVALVMLLLVTGWTIPFQFESFSVLYKFGVQKVLLRSGKVIGLTVVLLLFFQILLASHLKFLELIYSRKLLFTLHRLNGFLVTLLVMVHPLLIKASENFVPYTLEKKYYPEYVGIVILLVTLAVFISAILRKRIGTVFGNKWLVLHRLGSTLVLLILPFHVLWVSDTFKSGGLPRSAALIIFSINILLIFRIWLRRTFS